ncbi:putative IQ motif, EF-hand binding protein [Arabidopsis thaliana]|uniref:Iqd33 n=2 Tax=Arabidopsis TaxID=3701 RepID=A0A178U8P3_ARATH|nr:IQ motif EF-hand binding site [Arabidopsis thaliana x Arabidopsis arenosa]OAO90203.1 iqd33 [Arabidopsis thaliana]
MGVTGGLVRSIFFRNKSFGAHDYNNGRGNLGEKKRWSSVRSYLCGDEFNSVRAVNDSESIKDSEALLTMSQQLSSEFGMPFGSVIAIEDSASVRHLEDEDSGSVKSSEATVTQPLLEEKSKGLDCYLKEEDVEDNQSEATETHIPKKHQTTPISKLFLEEDAAVIIQSAFRSYLAIRRSKEEEETFAKEESFSGEESQDNASMGTSIEAQTGNSVKAPFFRRKRVSANRRTLQKNNTQVLRIKEDWDDSTVSSTISKSRIQSRVEAMTKRERALAYAFSQQLRICSKKKQIDRSSEDDSNIGWSWLERWMATRVPDSIPIEPRTDVATKNQSLIRKNRAFGTAGELESCASNDLPLHFESISETQGDATTVLQTEKSSFKPSISKRKSVPSYKSQRKHHKLQATKSDLQQQTKKAKKAKTTPTSCKTGNECEETSHKLNSST